MPLPGGYVRKAIRRCFINFQQQKTGYICVVKFLALLFSCWLLLLPCFPCPDVRECVGNIQTARNASDHQKEQQHEDEACSPFCFCACCGQVCAPSLQRDHLAAIASPGRRKPQCSYTNHSRPSDFPGNIWQPPRCS